MEARRQANGKVVGGTILVVIGLFSLVAQRIPGETASLVFFPALALLFFGWGVYNREAGLMIPGGVLAGLGLGFWAVTQLGLPEGNDAQGGAFLAAFAAGWVLITAMSALFTTKTYWWALIPAAILAAVAGALLAGGVALEVLVLFGTIWPVALIVFGLYLLARRQSP
jgi:hypothetical protein